MRRIVLLLTSSPSLLCFHSWALHHMGQQGGFSMNRPSYKMTASHSWAWCATSQRTRWWTAAMNCVRLQHFLVFNVVTVNIKFIAAVVQLQMDWGMNMGQHTTTPSFTFSVCQVAVLEVRNYTNYQIFCPVIISHVIINFCSFQLARHAGLWMKANFSHAKAVHNIFSIIADVQKFDCKFRMTSILCLQ